MRWVMGGSWVGNCMAWHRKLERTLIHTQPHSLIASHFARWRIVVMPRLPPPVRPDSAQVAAICVTGHGAFSDRDECEPVMTLLSLPVSQLAEAASVSTVRLVARGGCRSSLPDKFPYSSFSLPHSQTQSHSLA